MDWADLISRIGLPGAMTLGLGYYLKYTQDKASAAADREREANRQDMKEMHASNRQDSAAMREAINNNTMALKLLLQKEGYVDDAYSTARTKLRREVEQNER